MPELSRQILGVAVAASTASAGAGTGWVIRAILVLLFITVAPTAAIAGLLRTLDVFARLIIAGTATVTVLALIAIIMLAEGAWSPTNGLVVVIAITAACLVAQVPLVRRGILAQAVSCQKAAERMTDRVRHHARPADAADYSPPAADQGSRVPAADQGTGGPAAGQDGAGPPGGYEDTDTAVIPVVVSEADANTAEIPVIQVNEPADPGR